ncbi:hypothetical protein NUU61_000082 [Penicillium alfredii]|uniref:Major facilitator superfamily (MFS) profile domain-containing protein n=1 Tax=Penicillium alfredii TaxID=1506179 RepID=A0A9W9G918_9EURO|nr:uncharacterized protein NUU61_000082 [Penicillium alfredii]KAJ5114323.1 hypothetical protein NUU61_000082 [Penicillium alfredii]
MVVNHEEDHLVGTENRQISKKLLILTACAMFVLAADFGFYCAVAPQTAVFEDIICRNFQVGAFNNNTNHTNNNDNATDSIPDGNPCKSEAVQGELALVLGYKDMFDMLPGLVFSLPYGVLSDHWGRRPVLYLGVVGILLADIWIRIVCFWSNVIPLRMVWLSGLWRVIGGGDQVVTSMALVMVADIFSEEERSTALFRLQSCATLAEILATPVSAYLMTFDPWAPYLIGICMVALGGIASLFLPETLEDAKAKQAQPDAPESNESEHDLLHQAHEFKQSTQFIWRDWNMCLMVVVLFVTVLSKQSTNVLLQYVSKRFDWSLARASLLISLRGSFTLANYLILMPALSFLAARYLGLHGKWRDYRLTQGSGALSAMGFAAMSLAPAPAVLIGGLVILSLGAAFLVTARSLATSLVRPDQVGTLYSAIAIAQAAGMLVAGPLFANLFRLGMHMGSVWMGLPFLQAAAFYAAATVAIWWIRLGSVRSGEEEWEIQPLLAG